LFGKKKRKLRFDTNKYLNIKHLKRIRLYHGFRKNHNEQIAGFLM